MYGGAAFATPTCQPLAPGLPGLPPRTARTRHTPAPTEPTAVPTSATPSAWSRGRARAVERVDVLGSADEGYVPPGVAPYVARVLRSLGYRTTLHLVPFASITHASAPPAFTCTRTATGSPTIPAPSSYIPPFFSCDGGQTATATSATPRSTGRCGAPKPSSSPTRRAANAAWTSIDRTLTNQADWVPTVNLRVVDLVSKRLGNYQFNPVWGFLADQSEIQ